MVKNIKVSDDYVFLSLLDVVLFELYHSKGHAVVIQ